MSDDLERIGSTVWAVLGRGAPRERRLALEWPRVVGPEIARNAQPRSLRGGRLVVATSSSVWAQTLQLMGERIRRGLNAALGSEVIAEIVFRPAGWDPGAGEGAPRPLGSGAVKLQGADGCSSLTGAHDDEGQVAGRQDYRRRLTAAEERAIDEVRRLACDEVLGEQIARTMRAYLERQQT